MKNWINRILNLALYLSLCFMIATGILMWFRLPPKQGRTRGGRHGQDLPQILGLDRHDWGEVHFYTALAFVILCLAHLYMNWTWLRKIAAGKHAWRLWLGLAIGAAIILFFIFIPIT